MAPVNAYTTPPAMMRCGRVAILIASFILPTFAAGPTTIWINDVPGYSRLAACAEAQVSTIVRNMYSGCGDDSHTTSFACFCYESSRSFDSIISTAVVNECRNDGDPSAQAVSALDVFSSYCAEGTVLADVTVSPTASSTGTPSESSISSLSSRTAVPAPTASSVMSTSPPSATGESQSDSLSGAAIAGIAVSVVVGITMIALAAALVRLRRRSSKQRLQPSQLSQQHAPTPPGSDSHRSRAPQELASNVVYEKDTDVIVELGVENGS